MASGFSIFRQKYVQWAAIILACLAVIIWGNLRKNRAADQLDRLQKQIQFVQTGPIEPNAAVLDSLNEAIDQLRKRHSGLDVHLFTGPKRSNFDGDSTAAYFELASFIETTSQRMQSIGIATAEGERFGFSQFEQQGPTQDILPAVMAQKHAASVLVDALLEAEPDSLTFLKRELILEDSEDPSLLQQAAGTQSTMRTQYEDTLFGDEKIDGFESYTFELQFEGYTEALRRFMTELTDCNFPVMVKQLHVDPLDRYEEAEKSLSAGETSNPFDVLAAVDEEEVIESVPIIRNNLSSFTVRMEVFLGEEARTDS